jgi:outer membrane biosynthesis protein TonB
MKAGVATSVIAHAALLIIAVVGLGSARPLEPEVVESIAVDLVPISAITNIRAGSLESKIVETETPAVAKSETPAELAKPTGNTEEDQVAPKETAAPTPAPTTNTAPEPEAAPQPETPPAPVEKPPDPTPPTPVAEPDPAPVEEQVPQEVAADTAVDTPPVKAVAPMPVLRPAQLQKAPAKKPDVTKVAEATPAPKTPTKTETPKKPTKAPSDQPTKEADLTDLVQNLEKSRGATTGAGGEPTLGKNDGRASTLTQSQLDGLVAQIKGCMNIPAGAADAGITAQLLFSIDASGNVTGTPEIVSAGASTLERALASAAQRAVKRCGPYQMALNQQVKATFDPRELM